MGKEAVQVRWETIPGWLDKEPIWGNDGYSKRSSELSPLYVRRYVGPHQYHVLGFHEFWELIYVIRGKGILNGHSPRPLRSTFAYLIPPGVPHKEHSNESMDLVWIGLQGSILQKLESRKIHAVEAPDLGPLVEQLWLRAERRFGCIGPELDGLARAVIGRFLRLESEAAQHGADLLDESIDHLHRNFARQISIADLAARYGYSKGYFFRAFKRRTGVSPSAYLARIRVENAAKLLQHSSLKIGRIARLCGYDDALYFSRVFRKVAGRNPSSLRTRCE